MVVASIGAAGGWTVVHNQATTGDGAWTVSSFLNIHGGWTVVMYHPNPAVYARGVPGFIAGEAFDLATGTVTNPSTAGAFPPSDGGVAYAAPVPLGTVVPSHTPPQYQVYAGSTNSPSGISVMVTPKVFLLKWQVQPRGGSSSVSRCNWGAFSFQPINENIEPSTVRLHTTNGWSTFYSSTGNVIGFASGTGVNRLPFVNSETPALDVDFTHASHANYATLTTHRSGFTARPDLYAADPAAHASSRARLIRPAGVNDGFGFWRGQLVGVRAREGATPGPSHGDVYTDGDGDTWQYVSLERVYVPAGAYRGTYAYPGWYRTNV